MKSDIWHIPARVSAATLLALALCGCGARNATQASTALSNTPKYVDICDLVDQHDIETTLNEAMNPPSLMVSGEIGCIYTSKRMKANSSTTIKPAAAKAVLLRVVLFGARAAFAQAQRDFPQTVPIPSMGDQAFYAASVSGLVFALKDGKMVMVFVSDTDNFTLANSEAAELLQQSLGNLPHLVVTI